MELIWINMCWLQSREMEKIKNYYHSTVKYLLSINIENNINIFNQIREYAKLIILADNSCD